MNDLRDRFTKFSKDVLIFSRTLSLDTVSRPLVSQLVRSTTSVGANYTEAQSGISKNDFRSKVYISLKEAEEAKYWLELLKTCFPEKDAQINELMLESEEVVKILQSIVNKLPRT